MQSELSTAKAAQQEPLLDAAALRSKILQGRVPDDVLASALGIGLRMVYYYAERGMPFIRIAGRRHFSVDEAVDWLSKHKGRKPVAEPALLPPPRPVGRPRTIPVPGAQARPERLPATNRAKGAVQAPKLPRRALATGPMRSKNHVRTY